MPGGLIALLDDVAALAKLAAASVDDVAGAAGKASAKAAGVVIDDAAVTPKYVMGLSPDRELPIIGKITLGSLRNKLLFLLPAALALSEIAPWAITPLLMIGGSYLSFEAMEKIWGALSGESHAEELVAIHDPVELEKRQVTGAVRTDFILSGEIMAVALNSLPEMDLLTRAGALALVAILITFGVYGSVALIVKMDDIGLHLCRNGSGLTARFGRGLVNAMPRLLKAIALIGTAAMLWVGGGIFLHGLEAFHFTPIPEVVDHLSEGAGEAISWASGVAEWLVEALCSAAIGIVLGSVLVGAMHLVPGIRSGH